MTRLLRTAFLLLAVVLVGALLPTPALAQGFETDVEQRAAVVGQTVTGVEPFDMIAVSWTGGAATPPPVEVHTAAGWEALPSDTPGPDAGPDAGTREERRDVESAQFSDPVWVGSADGYRVGAAPGVGSVAVHLIRDHEVVRPAITGDDAGAAPAPPDGPAVNLRGAWGAAPPKEANAVARSLKFAVVHHTAGTNNYQPGDVPAILRGIQSFHQNSRGWNDIAYNFLIDKWGGVWEGRAGGIGRPIVGSHAAGFNTSTVGISLLGDFSSTEPTQAAVDATADVASWKLALAGVRPNGTTTVVGTSDNVFPTGQTVTIPTIVGHSDVGTTDCPGRVRNYLAAIRAAAANRAPYVTARLDILASPSKGRVRVNGWALDRRSDDPVRYLVDINGVNVLDRATSLDRPDIRSSFPSAPLASGFDATVDLTADSSEVCVYIAETSYGALTRLGCQTFATPISPRGGYNALDPAPGGAVAAGWAYDPDASGATEVRFTVDGKAGGSVSTSLSRLDVVSVIPEAPLMIGWSAFFALGPGRHEICATAVNRAAGADIGIGCKQIGADPNPIGTLDGAVPVGNVAVLYGWALDRDAGTGPAPVLLFVNGRMAGLANANLRWPNLAPFFPEYGIDHGFFTAVAIPKGRSDVCAAALNVGPGVPGTLIGCRSVRR